MFEWIGDLLSHVPNWVKPLPGLLLLGIAVLMLLNGTLWFFGWGAGVALTCAGLMMMGKKNDYNF
jgi:hypothetical protein